MSTTTCIAGHEIAAGHAYCPQCGAPRRTNQPTPPVPAAVAAEPAAPPPAAPQGSRVLPPPPSWSSAQPPAPGPQAFADRVRAVTSADGRPKWLIPAVAGAAAVLLIGVVWAASAAGSGNTITGSLVLTNEEGYDEGYGASSGCSGSGGYDDIDFGTEVVVRDGDGQLLATSMLESGEDDLLGCTFPFEVTDVPNADFYSIEVSHRGDLSYSHSEMEANGWVVGFELG